jgi:hypothetical protein
LIRESYQQATLRFMFLRKKAGMFWRTLAGIAIEFRRPGTDTVILPSDAGEERDGDIERNGAVEQLERFERNFTEG